MALQMPMIFFSDHIHAGTISKQPRLPWMPCQATVQPLVSWGSVYVPVLEESSQRPNQSITIITVGKPIRANDITM